MVIRQHIAPAVCAVTNLLAPQNGPKHDVAACLLQVGLLWCLKAPPRLQPESKSGFSLVAASAEAPMWGAWHSWRTCWGEAPAARLPPARPNHLVMQPA